jgi:hypothetical protein
MDVPGHNEGLTSHPGISIPLSNATDQLVSCWELHSSDPATSDHRPDMLGQELRRPGLGHPKFQRLAHVTT